MNNLAKKINPEPIVKPIATEEQKRQEDLKQEFIDKSIALMLASKAEDSEDSDEKLDLALAKVSKEYDEMLEKQKQDASEAANRQIAEDAGQIYGGTSLTYHEALDVSDECFSDAHEMGQHRRVEFVTNQDLHAIVGQIAATNPEAANLLRGLDLNRITREITEEFLHELPKGESEPRPITIGGVFTEILGIHSAYAGGQLIQGLNAAAKTPYGKKIIDKLLQHAGSALKSEAVKYAVDRFYSSVDDIADYFNKPFEKAKASDANKNKAASKNLPTSSIGGGQLPEDPDEEEKRYEIVGSKDAQEIGRTEAHGKIYKDPLNQKWGNKEIWLSKDNAGHGGSKHKVYVESNKGFQKVGELDESGKVMNKHMSDTGNFINSKDIIWIKR